MASARVDIPIDTTSGTPTLLVEAEVGDPATVDAFMADLVHRVLIERMMAAPETAAIRITVIGDLTAAQLAERWRRQVARDPAMAFFMSKMTSGELVRVTPLGHVVDRASLLGPRR